MSQTMYRIYRYSENDPFRAPRGWLAMQLKKDDKGKPFVKQQWVPSDEITERDTYSRGEAEALVSQWNDYWASKGWEVRADMEIAK